MVRSIKLTYFAFAVCLANPNEQCFASEKYYSLIKQYRIENINLSHYSDLKTTSFNSLDTIPTITIDSIYKIGVIISLADSAYEIGQKLSLRIKIINMRKNEINIPVPVSTSDFIIDIKGIDVPISVSLGRYYGAGDQKYEFNERKLTGRKKIRLQYRECLSIKAPNFLSVFKKDRYYPGEEDPYANLKTGKYLMKMYYIDGIRNYGEVDSSFISIMHERKTTINQYGNIVIEKEHNNGDYLQYYFPFSNTLRLEFKPKQ